MPEATDVLDWRGRTAVDSDGDKLGTIEEIYLDAETERPEWALVQEEHEVVLHEKVVVDKRTVPKERVRVDKDVTTDEQQVTEQLRKEQIETEGTSPRR